MREKEAFRDQIIQESFSIVVSRILEQVTARAYCLPTEVRKSAKRLFLEQKDSSFAKKKYSREQQ